MVHRLSTTPAPTESSRRQKGDTKPFPYWGPTEIRRQWITFSDHGEFVRLCCTPVALWVPHRHAFVRITKLQNQHTKILWTAVIPQGCILLPSTQCFGQEFCVGSSEVTHPKHDHCGLQQRQTACRAFIFYYTQIERVFGASLKPTSRTAVTSRLIMFDSLHVCLLQLQQVHFSNNPYGRKIATDAARHIAASQSSSPY